jgi:serine/threonine protein kinase
VIIQSIDEIWHDEVVIKFPLGACEETEFEADLLFRLDHESIIRLRDIIPMDNGSAIVVPYARGGDLFSLVENHGGLPESSARIITHNLLSALSYCHQEGVWHRDVKLENLFILTDDLHDTVLADFGYGIDVLKWGFDGQFPGSRSYAAPEIWGQRSYTEKVDIWSAGVTLYAIVTDAFPYDIIDGFDPEKCIAETIKNLSGDHNLAHVSPDCRDLIMKMLRFDPNMRISAQDALEHKWFNHMDEVIPGEIEMPPLV